MKSSFYSFDKAKKDTNYYGLPRPSFSITESLDERQKLLKIIDETHQKAVKLWEEKMKEYWVSRIPEDLYEVCFEQAKNIHKHPNEIQDSITDIIFFALKVKSLYTE